MKIGCWAMALAMGAVAMTGRAESRSSQKPALPEVRFTMAEWDSPLIPLGITPYYLTVNSPVMAKAVEMSLDLYVKGKFARTISLGRITAQGKPQAVKMNCALYLDPRESDKVAGTLVLEWAGTRSLARFAMTPQEFPMKEGLTQAFEGAVKLPFSGNTPLFVLMAGGGGFSMPAAITDAPGANPGVSVLLGVVRTE